MESTLDETQFTTLYETWGPMVLRRCRFILRDEDLAVDAMQETFMKVLGAKSPLDLTQPATLLWRMATQVCLNLIRSRTRRREDRGDAVLEQIASIDDLAETSVRRDEVERLLAGEDLETRYMAMLHYVDDFTLEQVARETGFSVSGVRKRLQGLKDRARNLNAGAPHAGPQRSTP